MSDSPTASPSDAPRLDFTGERFTPECVREIWYEHWHRYAMAAAMAGGRKVLDLACGEGYGAHLLSGFADSVVGVDCDPATVAHARSRYVAGNLRFEVGDATAIPAPDRAFDLVVSFETIEHLAAQDAMLEEFHRVLRADGLLLISSPDRARYSDESGYRNEYHVRELYRDELLQLLKSRFPAVKLFGQQLMFHSCIWPLDRDAPNGLVCQSLDEGDLAQRDGLSGRPLYFIAACAASDSALPAQLDANWLFSDAAQSVYDHYQHEIGKNMAAGRLLAERDARISELEAELARAQGEGG